ncbi:hypothetical protein [Planctomicrobium piriforme]|uniref:Uncharacterized protein n=1 Tax=Planctomicrobium piriforme TaxID=1576369 RepID=A0A1I3PC72_9PLAN|nr:hypothetical protein [Planctomicrobium piriforme]SFJ19011.1 hypothetical protein SAMN05421753_116102 [Planctomicrobium piriforme]
MTAPHIHRIRLQGPWQVIPPGEERFALQEVWLPATWTDLFGQSVGTATFLRSFNSPTNIDEQDRLWIRLPPGCGEVMSFLHNGVSLNADSADPMAFEITSTREIHNRIEITLTGDPSAFAPGEGGLWQPVLLEIVSGG